MFRVLIFLLSCLYAHSASAQFGYTFGQFGIQSTGSGSGGALTMGAPTLSTLVYSSGSYSGTISFSLTGTGTATGPAVATLSTTGGCSGHGGGNGSFSISGFTLSGSTLSGSYDVCISMSQPGATNTPQTADFTITGSAGYNGLADVVGSSPLHYWGVRALSGAEATAGTAKLFNVTRNSDSHICDFLVASGGGIGAAANCSTGGENGTAWATWIGSATGIINTLYDRGSGTACDLTQGTTTWNPTITAANPYPSFDGSLKYISCAMSAISTPLTIIAAINPSGAGTASFGAVVSFGTDTGNGYTGHYLTWTSGSGTGYVANQVNVFDASNGGSSFSANNATGSLTAGTFGSAAGTFNSATSRIPCLNATCGSSDSASIAPTTQDRVYLGTVSGTTGGTNVYYNGYIAEAAIWGSTLNSTALTNASNNQSGYGW